ncbi:MAG TPA: cation diffusion facilitator family transporter [Spirochaetota bacterium]|nr:cation diffusion facilitator family transporter [Spirochaetota bacterium]
MGHDHSHSHGHHDHGGDATGLRLLFTILFNIVITITEYVGGVLSGSLALISDAGHNFSDVLSLILGYAGERVSKVKTGRVYTFGLRRFEVLIALINALSLVAIGIYIVYEAVERYLNPQPVAPGMMIAVACIGLGGNLLSIIVLFKTREQSLNLRSAFLHLLYDTISSVAVVVTGIVLWFTNIVILDLVVSVLIVVMIFFSSLDIIREAMRIFMQGAPKGIDPGEVHEALLELPGVGSIHGLHIWSVNSTEVFLSCHVCLDQEVSPDSDDVIHRVNHFLEEHYHITHTTIQVERDLVCRSGDSHSCCG